MLFRSDHLRGVYWTFLPLSPCVTYWWDPLSKIKWKNPFSHPLSLTHLQVGPLIHRKNKTLSHLPLSLSLSLPNDGPTAATSQLRQECRRAPPWPLASPDAATLPPLFSLCRLPSFLSRPLALSCKHSRERSVAGVYQVHGQRQPEAPPPRQESHTP